MKRVEQLIVKLNDDEPAVRDTATRELQKLGAQAELALRHALAGMPPLEARQRLEALLADLKDSPPSPEELRQTRAIAVLEQIGSPQARQVLKTVAQGAALAPQTQQAQAALERLRSR